MTAESAAVVENIGIEAVVAILVRLSSIIDSPATHTIFINMVLGGRIGAIGAGERRCRSKTVETMTELVGIVAIVGMLHFKNRLLTVLGQEYLTVFVANAILRGGSNGDKRIGTQSKELLVGSPGFLEHGLRLVAGKSQVFLVLMLEHLAAGPEIGLGLQHQSGSLGDTSHIGRLMGNGKDGSRSIGLLDNEVYHLLIGSARRLLGIHQRVNYMVDDERTAKALQKQVVEIGPEEMGFAFDTSFLTLVGYPVFVGKERIDILNLRIVIAPRILRPRRNSGLVGLQDVTISTVEPVAAPHRYLVAKPRHEIARHGTEARHGEHIIVEAAVHAVIPGVHIFVEQHGVGPGGLFRNLVHRCIIEQVVATGGCHERQHRYTFYYIATYFHCFVGLTVRNRDSA